MPFIKSHSITVTGAAHAKCGRPCQDYSGSLSCGAYHIIAVSDGHGGGKYFRSGAGARFAVETAIACVKDCLLEEDENHRQVFVDALLSPSASEKDRAARIRQLEGSMLRIWNHKVQQSIAEDPFSEQELLPLDADTRNRMTDQDSDYRYKAYGATLLVAAAGPGFWFGLQIGDGTIAVKGQDGYAQPVELDEGCVGTYTTSICDRDAISLFHYAWGDAMPQAVFLASDGVEESFATKNGFYKFCDTVLENSLEDWEGNITELRAYLPELSRKGSRDDMSLAWIHPVLQECIV